MKTNTRLVLATALIMLFAIGIASAITVPTVDFTASSERGPYPLTVTFTATTTGMTPPLSYEWDFGDNSGAVRLSGTTITHTYTTPGSYDVRLAVNDLGIPTTWWVSNTKEDFIFVTHVKPDAYFVFTPHIGPSPLTVSFTDLTVGDDYTVVWDFDDGTQSTDYNPVHTYTIWNRPYTISLNATNDGGSDTYIDILTVRPPVPDASFTTDSPATGQVPLAVQFKDTSEGVGITQWNWTFGDGGTSDVQNPLHAYGAIGLYDVSLKVTSISGDDTSTREDFINVTEATGPVVCPTPEPTPIPTLCPIPTPLNPLDIGVYKNGAWVLDYDGSGGWSAPDKVYSFGATGYTPVVGDWNGNGKAKVGVYKDGAWYLDYLGEGTWTANTKAYSFGAVGYQPVRGDWNLDGKTEIGVYKDGLWILDYDGSGNFTPADKVYSFGATGWVPVLGKWS